jgi:hypothetical protein
VRFTNPAGTILAFVDLETPSGIRVLDAKLMRGPQGTRFLGMPGAKSGSENRKAVWRDAVTFRNKTVRERFQRQFLSLLRRSHPELFTGEDEQ